MVLLYPTSPQYHPSEQSSNSINSHQPESNKLAEEALIYIESGRR